MNWGYVTDENLLPCWNCGKVTEKLSITFHARLCSKECEHEKLVEMSEESQ